MIHAGLLLENEEYYNTGTTDHSIINMAQSVFWCVEVGFLLLNKSITGVTRKAQYANYLGMFNRLLKDKRNWENKRFKEMIQLLHDEETDPGGQVRCKTMTH
mmetsp:Transcript_6519/g.7457  ORF Transcript_6519/g.7457 Transcript_6519/m.7457 type:complete len:102 (+) Transcript_6519:129-434(+)